METIGLISSLLLMTFVFNSVTCKILTQSFVIRLKEIAQVIEDQKQVIEDQEEIIKNLNITQESMKEQVEELNNTQESMKEQVEELNTTVMEHDSCLTEQSNKMAAINTTAHDREYRYTLLFCTDHLHKKVILHSLYLAHSRKLR